jgi:hypothetical protein
MTIMTGTDAGMTKKECLGEVDRFQEKVLSLRKNAQRGTNLRKVRKAFAKFDNADAHGKRVTGFLMYANDGLINDLFSYTTV